MDATSVATVGWVITTLGWVISPMVARLLNEGFALLSTEESAMLSDLEALHLPRLALLREHTEPINRLYKWAERLKSAFLDAEDVLDSAEYRRLKKKMKSPSGIKCPAWITSLVRIFSRKNRKLKKSLKKLQNIVKEGFEIWKQVKETTTEVAMSPTTSSPLEPVIGRDDDRYKIIRMLREASSDSTSCHSTIGIYGIAGSGKTTLAQHVCRYEQEEDYFSPVIWIDVSRDFDLYRIYKQILEEAMGKHPGKYSNLDCLEKKLKMEMRGKRFLLVLDGMRRYVPEQEQRLLTTLNVGKKGSKILVTTLSEKVAASLGLGTKSRPIKIPDLTEKHFLDLFMSYALRGVRPHEQELKQLETIGQDIAEQLGRSPFAASRVGCKLSENKEAKYWQKISDNQEPNPEIIEKLWQIFHHLGDQQVGRCFAYCSMFPRMYEFKRDELVRMWMAEGFIQSTNRNKMEDIGKEYFDELLSWSFIQKEGKPANSDEDSLFTIPDMLHQLAEKVSGSDSFRVLGDHEVKEFPSDVRHLFITSRNAMKYKNDICKMKKLRTLIIRADGAGITEQVFESMLKKLKKLRVVQVYLNPNTKIIPESVCGLKHLRFLSIWESSLTKVKLPKKFGKLYNLQTIELPPSCALDWSGVKKRSNLVTLRIIINSGTSSYPYVESQQELISQEINVYEDEEEPLLSFKANAQ